MNLLVPNLKPETVAQWSQFFTQHQCVMLYTVDPGAYALGQALHPILVNAGRFDGWYAEGWSEQRVPNCRPVSAMLGKLAPGISLLLGSQTNFERTHEILDTARARGAATVFVFDHWKNYAEHFLPNLLPDTIVAPDELGKRALLAAIGSEHAGRVTILPHLGIEAAAQRIQGFSHEHLPGVIALLLDPTENRDGLGYDWRTVMGALPALADRFAPSATFHIKPHPRQRAEEIAALMQSLGMASERYQLVDMDTECLIAAADEVWGMTTIALVAAHRAGKVIRSIQTGRNEKGKAASNHYIEPYLI